MRRDIWVRSFSEKKIPRYPCPHCFESSLKLFGSVNVVEPAYSEAQHGHEAFEPDWVVERLNFQLRCDILECGEIVNIIGERTLDWNYDDEYEGLVELVRPTGFFPAPPMIELPENTPSGARKAVEQAFAVCWADTGSAANRIRVSVELALDELQVPRTGTSKKDGKSFDLDLNGRLQWLEKQAGAHKEHASTFQALRVAGNAGSHGSDDISWSEFLDCLLLYEVALEDLFGSKGEIVAKAKASLLELKKKKER